MTPRPKSPSFAPPRLAPERPGSRPSGSRGCGSPTDGGPDSVRLIGAIVGVCEGIEQMLMMAGCSDHDTHDRTVRMAAAAAILAEQVLRRSDID